MSTYRAVKFDRKTLTKIPVVEIFEFGFETLVCCSRRTKPPKLNLATLYVIPFLLCPVSCSWGPSFSAENLGHISRGMELQDARFDLVRFYSVLSFEPSFVSKSPDLYHRNLAFLLFSIW